MKRKSGHPKLIFKPHGENAIAITTKGSRGIVIVNFNHNANDTTPEISPDNASRIKGFMVTEKSILALKKAYEDELKLHAHTCD